MSMEAKRPSQPKWSIASSGATLATGTPSPRPTVSAVSRNGTPSPPPGGPGIPGNRPPPAPDRARPPPRRCRLQGQPEQPGRVEPVHGRPLVGAVAHHGRDALVAREVDEHGHEGDVALAVHA